MECESQSPPNCKACDLTAVDPFLIEALLNPRHRLTILRMELDVQTFVQNHEQRQFEFPHFPTSYLRLAAHRVAQHYGLQTMVADSSTDCSGSKIIVRKTAESKYPAVCLSDVPANQPEVESCEQIKVAIKRRPRRSSSNDAANLEIKQNNVKTVEERMEEYDKARARIFSSSSVPDLGSSSLDVTDGRSMCCKKFEVERCRNNSEDLCRTATRESISRVAIFRDREKDRSDPDYDRSYDRYARSPTPNQNIGLGPIPMLQQSMIQYDNGFAQISQFPRTQSPVNFRPSNPAMSPFSAVGSNPSSADALYAPWPNPTVMYAYSFEPFRHAIYQAQYYQQPLSFGYPQNQDRRVI